MSRSASPNAVAGVAALIGDPARAAILLALMGGRALAAGELAAHAGVTPQTASGHLARMLAAGVLAQEKQGRHRYYRLASAEIAETLEALMAVAARVETRRRAPGPRDAALRLARTCYDHAAGRLGVALAEALAARGYVRLADGAAAVTEEGQAFLAALGVEIGAGRRPLCRACLDWSERRPHLAGRLGAALLAHALASGWVRRAGEGRALLLTPGGLRELPLAFGLPSDWAEERP